MNIICKIFNHKWSYNWIRFPARRVCKRCTRKEIEINNPNYNFRNLGEQWPMIFVLDNKEENGK